MRGFPREHPELADWVAYGELTRRIRLYRSENRTGERSRNVRLSGGEPILSTNFFELLDELLAVADVVFVETNGVVLGHHPSWCQRLSRLRERMFLKVSVKAATALRYEQVTGVQASAWEVTFNALSLSPKLFPGSERQELLARLAQIEPRLPGWLQQEALTEYPETVRRMAGWAIG